MSHVISTTLEVMHANIWYQCGQHTTWHIVLQTSTIAIQGAAYYIALLHETNPLQIQRTSTKSAPVVPIGHHCHNKTGVKTAVVRCTSSCMIYLQQHGVTPESLHPQCYIFMQHKTKQRVRRSQDASSRCNNDTYTSATTGGASQVHTRCRTIYSQLVSASTGHATHGRTCIA